MNTLIMLVIWIAVIAVMVWAIGFIPADSRLVRGLQAVVAVIGALLIAQRFLV